jgi:hypothetical protein
LYRRPTNLSIPSTSCSKIFEMVSTTEPDANTMLVITLRYNRHEDLAQPSCHSFLTAPIFFKVHPHSEEEMRSLPSVTLTDGSKPCNPSERTLWLISDKLHSRRWHANKRTLIAWKRCLGFIPNHMANKTLLTTTQLVPTAECETRKIMRDHMKSGNLSNTGSGG